MEGNPNALSFLVLALSPFVSFAFVALLRAPISVPIVILAGQMFLPPVIQLPIPLFHLDKDVLPGLGALLGCLAFRRKSLARSRPWRGYDLFILVQMLGTLGTTLTNRDAIQYGPVLLPGLSVYDAFNSSVNIALYWWPPFYLGRSLYRTSKDTQKLFGILVGAGLVYSLFLMVEMVMSPQLNRWFYGFHQTEFLQTIRAGGYRPKAFMRHGLNVALFMLITVIASVTANKLKQRVFSLPSKAAMFYLVIVFVFCKSLGSLAYAAMLLPLVAFVSPPKQAKCAAVFAVILFSYPVVRALGWIPIDDINQFTLSHFGEDRAGSLAMRLNEEGFVMERALERIVFGWGGYARQFRHDLWSGKNLATIDGQWAIVIGMWGAVGYVAMFGLLLMPAWRARKTIAKIVDGRDRYMVASLAMMAVVYTMDLIPNSSIDQYLTFLVGVLAGTERWLVPVRATVAAPVPPEAGAARVVPAWPPSS